MSTTSEERPGRYQRSAAGLAVALVVTVVAVLALLWVLGWFRSDLEVRPEPIDYLTTVAGTQQSGVQPVYPASLPDGWYATGAEVPVEQNAVFELRLLTDADRFVGVRQDRSTSVMAVVAAHVDEDATEIEPYRTEDSVAPVWQGFEDVGGDTGYAAEVGRQVVLVYGSAPPEDLQALIDLLTQAPVVRS